MIAPALLAIACGGDSSSPTPSPAPSPALLSPTPKPTPEPTPTPQPEFTIRSGTLAAGAIVFRGESAADPPGVFLADSDGVRRIGDRLYRGGLALQDHANGLTRIGDRLYELGLLVWSPDGTKVAFWVCPNDPPFGGELYVADSDGTRLTNVSNHPAGDAIRCGTESLHRHDWSPDGRSLVFWSGRDPTGLYAVNADGSGLSFLAEGILPAWSPAGNSIVFVNHRGEGASNWEAPLYLADPDGSNRRLLARVPCINFLGGCGPPALGWSPDGTTLAFSATVSELVAPDVFVINADGTGLTNISESQSVQYFHGWVNCQLPLPTAGCEVAVTDLAPQPLDLIPQEDCTNRRCGPRSGPGTSQPAIGGLSEGDTVCLLGSPAIKDAIQWWPVRTAEGTEGWAAAFDPDEPDKPWLTATGRTCQGEQVE